MIMIPELGSLSQSSAILPETSQAASSDSSSPYHLLLSIEHNDIWILLRSDVMLIYIYNIYKYIIISPLLLTPTCSSCPPSCPWCCSLHSPCSCRSLCWSSSGWWTRPDTIIIIAIIHNHCNHTIKTAAYSDIIFYLGDMTAHRVLPTGSEIEFPLQFSQNCLLTAKNNEDDNSLQREVGSV